MKERAVVISGMGTVSAAGCGRESVAAALAASEPLTSPVDRSAGLHRAAGARVAALAAGFEASEWIPPLAARRMCRPSKFALAAAGMAIEDAGLEANQAPGNDNDATATVLATSFGPIDLTRKILDQIIQEGPEAVSPAFFSESVANAPAARVALQGRARGANLTVSQGEAGPLIALERAAREVATGRAGRALAGSADEMPPALHAVLDRFGALCRGESDGSPRPFDRRRDGFLAGEGATVFVLETETAVRERGARVRARVLPLGGAFDPSAPRNGWPADGRHLARGLTELLDRAEVEIDRISRIVSGASGSPSGDRAEALVLRQVWGERPLPPVLVPKAVLGEYGGSLLSAALLAVEGALFGPTPGFREPDPDLGIVPHAGGDLPLEELTLVTSLAAGGAASWILLEGCRE